MLLVSPSRFACLFPMVLYLVYLHVFERSQMVMFEEVGCPERPSTSTTESPFFHQHVSAALVDRRIVSRIRTARFVRHRNFTVDWLILVAVVFEVKHLCRFFKGKKVGGNKYLAWFFTLKYWTVDSWVKLNTWAKHIKQKSLFRLWWFSVKGRDSHELPPKTCLSCISFVGGLSSNHQKLTPGYLHLNLDWGYLQVSLAAEQSWIPGNLFF